MKWYFVNIIILTYCEKNMFSGNASFFQGIEAKKSELRKRFANSRPKAKNFNVFEIHFSWSQYPGID